MTTAIFEIQKDKALLRTYTFHNLPITKEAVEAALLNITGLASDKYEVYYLDSQNDLIMTVVEEDYSIAEQTLQDDNIVFHIEVKVNQSEVNFQQQHNQPADNSSSGDLSDDQGEEEDLKQVYQSALDQEQERRPIQMEPEDPAQEKNQSSISYQGSQTFENTNLKPDDKEIIPENNQKAMQQNNAQQQGLSMTDRESSMISQSVEESSQRKSRSEPEPNNNEQIMQSISQAYIQEKAIEKTNQSQQQIIGKLMQNQSFLNALVSKVFKRLPEILKQECFKGTISQEKKIKSNHQLKRCFLCKQQIITIPFYFTEQNQLICSKCQCQYEESQILVKIRSQKQLESLLAVKIVPVYIEDVSLKVRLSLVASEVASESFTQIINKIAVNKITGRQI